MISLYYPELTSGLIPLTGSIFTPSLIHHCRKVSQQSGTSKTANWAVRGRSPPISLPSYEPIGKVPTLSSAVLGRPHSLRLETTLNNTATQLGPRAIISMEGDTMKRWQRFYIHGSIWLITEVVLSLMGLDDLADYSEFLQVRETYAAKAPIVIVL